MFNKIWWLFNKKPQGPQSIYFSLISTGLILGLFLISGSLLLILELWIMGSVVLLVGLLSYVNLYYLDKRRGYVEACHKVYLERREAKVRKLGKEDSK